MIGNVWTAPADRDLARISRDGAARIEEAVMRFALTGQGDVRALAGQTGNYRLRIGEWRVRFHLDDDMLVIDRILHRREAYRD